MSLSAWSSAVIGIELSRVQLFIPIWKRTFNHDYGLEYKFDPKTGKELWKKGESPIEGFDGEEKFHEFKVFYTSNQDNYVIGIGTESLRYQDSREAAFMKLPSEAELWIHKGRLEELLKPLNLWDENKYGLYNVMCAS